MFCLEKNALRWSTATADWIKRAAFASAVVLSFAASATVIQAQVPAQAPYVWKNVAIGANGRVTGMVQHPTSGDIYMRTDNGAYRWDRNATSWIPITDWILIAHNNWYGIESIAIDPSNANNVYIAAGSDWYNTDRAFFKSTDKGKTWTTLATTIRMAATGNDGHLPWSGERLAVDPNNSQILYFGSRADGLWKSVTGGTSWARVTSFDALGFYDPDYDGVGLSFVTFDKAVVAGGVTQVIYVGVGGSTGDGLPSGDTGLWRSIDGGATWAQAPGGPDTTFTPMRAEVASNGTVYVTYWHSWEYQSSGAIWRFAPGTSAWTNITPAQMMNFTAISVHPTDPNTLVAARYKDADCVVDLQCDQLYRSTTGGTTWKGPIESRSIINWGSQPPWMTYQFSGWISELLIDRQNPNSVWLCGNRGVWRTDNMNNIDINQYCNWSMFPRGQESMSVTDVKSAPNGTLLSTEWNGFRHSSLTSFPTDYSAQPDLYYSSSIAFAQDNPNFLARVGWTYINEVRNRGGYSRDGTTWSEFPTSPLPQINAGQIAISKTGARIFWLPETVNAPYFTDNLGDTWTQGIAENKSDVIAAWYLGKKPLAVDTVNANKVYYYNWSDGKIYTSSNGGVSYTPGAVVAKQSGSDIDTLKARPGVEGQLYLSLNYEGLYSITNSGATVTKINSVNQAYLFALGKGLNPTTPAFYVLGRVQDQPEETIGIYRSLDLGASWVRVSLSNFDGGKPQALEGDATVLGRVYLATDGRGIFYGQLKPLASRPQYDYDGDGKSDVSVFRPVGAAWYISNSSNGSLRGQSFGIATDKIAPADYDSDGKADVAVYRDGAWYIIASSTNTFRAQIFGLAGDRPLPADYDGDGLVDVAVFRPGTNVFYVLNSSNGALRSHPFGQAGDVALTGDFDGDGKSDPAIFRPANGTWYVVQSSNATVLAQQFGANGDLAAPADFDGDGKTDMVVFRPASGVWYILNSSDSSVRAQQFGALADRPAPADYDGDGAADIGVFRPAGGFWYILQSGTGTVRAQQFGASGDVAVPAAYVP